MMRSSHPNMATPSASAAAAGAHGGGSPAVRWRLPLEGLGAKLGFFVCLVLLYNANLRPIATGDTVPAALTPLAVVLDGTVRLDRFGPWVRDSAPAVAYAIQERPRGWHSTYPVAGSLLVTPLYVPIAFVPKIRAMPPATLYLGARVAEKLVASVLAAASAVLMLVLLQRIVGGAWAWWLSVIYAVGTATWATASQALWQHSFAAPLLVGVLIQLGRVREEPRAAMWAGVLAGLAIAVRPTNVVLLPAIAAGAIAGGMGRSVLWRLAVTSAIAPLAVAAYNFVIFGQLRGGYPALWDGRLLDGLTGLLFSPARGLLVYTPVVLFAAMVVAHAATKARQHHRVLCAAAATAVVAQVSLLSLWTNWWGGHAWGPRLLTETVPFLITLIAIATPAIRISRLRRALFAVLAVYGIGIQAIGAFAYPNGRWDSLPVDVDVAPSRLWDWRDNPVARALSAGPLLEPYAVLRAAVIDGVPAALGRVRTLGVQF